MRWRAGTGYDLFNVRWSRRGLAETQFEDRGLSATIDNVVPNSTYVVKVQSCVTHFLASSDCTAWETQEIDTTPPLAFGADTCAVGYVWREAYRSDRVCVTPQTRRQAVADNSAASERRNPSGDFGPDTCVDGFVWREAIASDHVCVTPSVRSQTASDNRLGESRRARPR
ncbi:MAG: hypothetical protein NVS3B17_23790 [Vulcanimicrobiaceae bacterium]